MARPARFEDVFEATTSKRGSLRCTICTARVVPPPEDEVEYIFWPGRKHLMGHPWVCSDCPRAFLTPNGLSKHRRAMHP